MAKNPKITEEEIALIKSAQAGDEPAFNKLYTKYSGFTTNLLYLYIKDYDESRDMNNFVWVKVYNNLSKFRDYSSFGGWLRILTNRVAIDYLRKMKDLNYVPEGLDVNLTEQDVNYGESPVDKMTYDQVVKEFKKLPEDVRKVFKLFYVDNLKCKEINEITGIPIGTIKSHLSRKRKLLQKRFNN